MSFRRRMMMAVNSNRRLPSGYTEVEYIRFNGYVYLNLPFSGNLDVKLDCVLRVTGGDPQNFAITQLFNGTAGQAARWFGLYRNYYTIGGNINFSSRQGTRIEADIEFRTINNNNRSITVTIDNETKSRYNRTNGTDGNLQLGINNHNYSCNSDYYSVIVQDTSSVLLGELVPAMDSNGVYGLYDVINNIYYTKAGGTGNISGGNPV